MNAITRKLLPSNRGKVCVINQSFWTLVAGVLMLLCVRGTAAGGTVVLTFDDLPTPTSTGDPIPDGYGGFEWTNMGYHLNNYGGYRNGCFSQPHVAFNEWARVAAANDGMFDFVGAYFAGAWNEDLNIRIEGYRCGILVYEQTVVASYYRPTWYTLDYQNIDKVMFESFGGYDASASDPGSGYHFVMDNFTVPEPATLSLLGLGGLAMLRRKRW